MLKDLEVTPGVLVPEFNEKVFEYEVDVDESTSFLDINYESDYPVTIYGNSDFTPGDNHVLIEVFNEKVYTYTIKVNKEKTENVFKTVQKVEDKVNPVWQDVLAPGIAVICFVSIVIIFCIIFKRK